MSHVCGFSPTCIIKWILRFQDWVITLPHISHLCGFSPVCVNLCFLRLSVKVNSFSHLSRFSPVCIICVFWEVKRFSQMLHLCGFSPICINRCSLRCPAVVNCSSQMLQLCILSCMYQLVLPTIPSLSELFPQTLHLHGISCMYH